MDQINITGDVKNSIIGGQGNIQINGEFLSFDVLEFIAHLTAKYIKGEIGHPAAYEFGPKKALKLNLIGEAESVYGAFDDLPDGVREALQIICHAIYQLREKAQQAKGGVLQIDNMMLVKIFDNYSISTPDFMTVINAFDRGGYCFDIEFFSIKQMRKSQPIIDYAMNDKRENGRIG